MAEPKIVLPKTHWSADEFIKLLNAVIYAKTPEEAEAARAELKRQRALLEANQKTIQGGPHHQN
jgi:tRNA U54 and U55 pseudouridine synthase Pus10